MIVLLFCEFTIIFISNQNKLETNYVFFNNNGLNIYIIIFVLNCEENVLSVLCLKVLLNCISVTKRKIVEQ